MSTVADHRRKEFIQAASYVFEKKGVRHATVSDITDVMGVTRSLFYHYFKDKDDIVNATIDEHVYEFAEAFRNWLKTSKSPDKRDRLRQAVTFTRSYLMGEDGYMNTIRSAGNASLLQQFTVRSAKRLATYYEESQSRSGTLEPYQGSDLRHPRVSFYILAIGIVNLIVQGPDVEDEVLVDLIADTLHISGA
jgi:AcrR family transcriptional regulator